MFFVGLNLFQLEWGVMPPTSADGSAGRRNAMNFKLGDEGLPFDSVEGHIAFTVYEKKRRGNGL